jgi:ABC-type sugar transport system ATPase subunit
MPAEDAFPLIEIRHLVKDFRGLRPLRIKELALLSGERAVILGFDAPSAETLVNLITGASLPDEGDVRVFGRRTTEIASSDDWLATVDRFGIVSGRVVLLEELSVAQNLAIPLTLDIDPVSRDVVPRITEMAGAVGLDPATLSTRVASIPPLDRARIRLARATALDPRILLLDHPSAALSSDETERFVADLVRTATTRGLTILALTADERLGPLASAGPWQWVPATGEIRRRSGWLPWLRS